MIQNVSMMGTPEDEQRDRDLGRAQDREHRQRVAHGHDARSCR